MEHKEETIKCMKKKLKDCNNSHRGLMEDYNKEVAKSLKLYDEHEKNYKKGN